jgi:lipopolysaccharide transport system ATP-binding protein
MTPVEYLWALRDVSFTVPSGCMLGVIGPNGAGKSTLLRLIGGVGKPDEGSVVVRGRVGALLDLGAGFHPDLTGRENIFVSGVISGLTRHEVAERFDSIVDFSELEEFIDSPIHTYSSGMNMRLAFAIAVHTEADIFLIDEVLAVGDISFQQKCLKRIKQFKSQGCAVILVSHDEARIEEFCDEALWLKSGHVMTQGVPSLIVSQYVADMTKDAMRHTQAV